MTNCCFAVSLQGRGFSSWVFLFYPFPVVFGLFPSSFTSPPAPCSRSDGVRSFFYFFEFPELNCLAIKGDISYWWNWRAIPGFTNYRVLPTCQRSGWTKTVYFATIAMRLNFLRIIQPHGHWKESNSCIFVFAGSSMVLLFKLNFVYFSIYRFFCQANIAKHKAYLFSIYDLVSSVYFPRLCATLAPERM